MCSLRGPTFEGLMHYLAAYVAFNVFQRKRNPALRCAVRQDQPMPAFIRLETWGFGGVATTNSL